MCGRFDTSGFTWAEIYAMSKTYAAVSTAPMNLEPSADVRPTTNQLTARIEDGAWTLEKMRWGLVPYWRNGKPLKDTAKGVNDGFKLSTFNSRVETCQSANTFKAAFQKRRCIVPVNAWFEWTGEPGFKTKHTFARENGGVIWFAGLWDRCTTLDAGEITSFTILTGTSAGWLSDYPHRAPVIVEPEDWSLWLDPSQDAEALLSNVRPERFVKAA